ncbi:electron transfer flavoprotein subunit beta [Hyphomonas adhaerens MHS-3]|uniref:Electron transfer flavoprotein subunit beta n=1 Tax=Hyphomonas adhaerens MHS-3 TaxID=1280949 RepID=A0A069E7S0_9PROT|nr:hypothetical protein [Hyphomonas adhaerens]KCZ86024.1 electron transfer flavoprotein subunit beta [Hyphomonas adhaerens MHS-3]
MKIIVFLAAILDPKWMLSLDPSGALPSRDPQKLALSPFDEAALELALRLREGGNTQAYVLEAYLIGEESSRLARKVAAYKPDRIETVSVGTGGLADRAHVARVLAERVAADGEPADVILIGREFGDCDDGAVPAMLARILGNRYVGLIHSLEVGGQSIQLQRRRDGVVESIQLDRQIVASVTNDKSNRLRHPLMKNAMQARTAEIGHHADPGRASMPVARKVSALRQSRPEGQCRILTGDIAAQTQELAEILRIGAAT